jgi:hypothetical protein
MMEDLQLGAHDRWNSGSPRRSLLALAGGLDWGGRASSRGQGEVEVSSLRDEKREALIGGRLLSPCCADGTGGYGVAGTAHRGRDTHALGARGLGTVRPREGAPGGAGLGTTRQARHGVSQPATVPMDLALNAQNSQKLNRSAQSDE